MNPQEIAALPPSMQKRYEDSKSAYLVPDNRLYLAPEKKGHPFAKTRKDAMRAFIAKGAGNTLPEEEPDGIPKTYFAWIVKEGFPTLDELPAPAIASTPATPATLTQVTQPAIATPAPAVTAPVDNA